MRVLKRDGSYESVSFDKVLTRVRKMAALAPVLTVPVDEIAQKVCSRIFDGVKTSELDELAAQLCSSLIIEHPDYGTLASRIIVSNHQKNTSPSFSETINMLYNHTDIHGAPNPLVSDELYATVMAHKEKLNSYIDYQRDFTFDYFGFKTLERSYLTRVNGVILERPQHMWMRVSLGIHGSDIREALLTYDALSLKYFTHATPTLFNAGTRMPQNSSCFLLAMHDDSVYGMYETLRDCALISKYAGGIGVHIHNIRAKGSAIRGTNGQSNGIIPMLRVFNAAARHIDQAGRRAGSFAVYLEPWHADIEPFLELKKNHGAEEERARDLFYALWIPDLFMERVESGGTWSLMCPDECHGLDDAIGDDFKTLYESYEAAGKFKKQVNAQDLWLRIMQSQIETGTPYMCYKDSVNRKTNQKNLGTIKSSNLCVAPETRVLTSKGYYRISDLLEKEIEVWNGEEFSKTTVFQTGENQKLITVKLSNGMELRCTPYHKFLVLDSTGESVKIAASELKLGTIIPNYITPVIQDNAGDLPMAFTQGIFCASGKYNSKEQPILQLVGPSQDLLELLQYKNIKSREHIYKIELFDTLHERCHVPINHSVKSKLDWLSGYLYGSICKDSDGKYMIVSNSRHVMTNVQLLFHTLGIQVSVISSNDKHTYYLQLTFDNIIKLMNLGMNIEHLELVIPSNYSASIDSIIRVTALEDNNEYADTYCFEEPKKNLGIFNGILTGQCSEINLFTNQDESAVCNLSSVCLPTFIRDGVFDFNKLHEITKMATKNLNKIIDGNLYPTQKTENSNLRHRPIGIGIQGLADTFAILKLAFDSPEAATLNKLIFETMYHAAVEQSIEIAKKREQLIFELEHPATTKVRADEINKHLALKDCERAMTEYRGAYSSFKGSPTNAGFLQYDLWNATPSSDRYDWVALKADLQRYGLRNSTLLAPMPTASTSQIMGYNECFEPFTSNLYKRKTMAGEFIIVNKYLMQDLLSLGLWTKEMKEQIMIGEGSIQGIDTIPLDIRDRYKTVWEIKQKTVIDMAAERGIYVCQSQSMNLFIESPDYKRLTSMHFYAWRKGLKTGMYYLRTKPKATTQQFTIDPRKSKSNIEHDSVVKRESPLKSEGVVTTATVKEEEDDAPTPVGCTWKPGCKTCSS